jgi:hypothetical protein
MRYEDLDGFSASPTWSALGKLSLSEWGALATSSRQSVPVWIRQCYNWVCRRHLAVYGRRLASIEGYEPKGPEGQTPILLYNGYCNQGSLGFLSVFLHSVKPASKAQDAYSAAQGAASWLAEWLESAHAFDANLGWPVIEMDLAEGDDGTSVGLSAFLATLYRLLGMELSEDVCATGVWCPAEGVRSGGRLAPVPEASLRPKAEAARRWAYGTLVVVEGQRGVRRVRRLFNRIVEVPTDPQDAALSILDARLEKGAADRNRDRERNRFLREWPGTCTEAVVKVLAAYDRDAVRRGPEEREFWRNVCDRLVPWTSAKHSRIIRHFAHDIRARAALHAGQSVLARKEAMAAKRLSPTYTLDGWIGDYLEWHQIAHLAVVEMDNGNWDEDRPTHRELRQKIERLNSLAPRRPGLIFARLALNNTLGLLLLFKGRLAMDRELLKQAWAARLAVRECWVGLFDEYCRKVHLRDSTMRRQHNICMDVISSWWELTGELPCWDYPKPFFFENVSAADINAGTGEKDRLEAFDVASVLKWQGIKRNLGHARDLRHSIGKEWARQASRWLAAKSGARHRPHALVAEAILRFTKPGEHGDEVKAAGDFLHSVLQNDRKGIRGVIVLRACHLLRMHGFEADWPEPPKGDGLRRLFKDLRSDERNILIRCPY